MSRFTLTRSDRYYVGTARSIAKRVLLNEYGQSQPHEALLTDTIREVEAYGTKVQASDPVHTIQVFDADGEAIDLPLDHPLVDWDTLAARRDDVRDVFHPDAYGVEKQHYAEELSALRRALRNFDRKGA